MPILVQSDNTNPATVDDITSRWRPLSTQETTNAQVFLEDAWRMLRRRVTDLEANVATDADLHAEAARVIAQAVLRVMKNPEGKRQESIDDYAWTRDQAVSSGLLYFTDAEINDLVPGEDARRGAWGFDLLGINGLGDSTDYPDARFPTT